MNLRIRGLSGNPTTIRARLMRGGSAVQEWRETTLNPVYNPPSTLDQVLRPYRTIAQGGDGSKVPDLSAAYVTVSRTTGPAPLGVTFQVRFPTQAQETAFIMFGTAVGQFSENPAESYTFQHLTERFAGETAGAAVGPFMGHVYVTPGAHEWSVTLYYPGLEPRTITATSDGGQALFGGAPVGQVVVTNQNEWFDDEATPRTRYFSPTAYASQSAMRDAMAVHYPAAASAPLGHFHYGSVAALKAAVDAVPKTVGSRPWRVLIEAGTTTTVTDADALPIELRNTTLDRIGTGADPIITVDPAVTLTITPTRADNPEGPAIFRNSDNTANSLLNTFGINNINFVGLYDPANPGNGVRLELCLIPIEILTSSNTRCAQLFRVRSNGWQYNLFYAGQNRGMVIADCNFDNWYNYGIWLSAPGPDLSLRDSALVGISAKQKLGTVNNMRWDTPDASGGNQKRSHLGPDPYTAGFDWALEPPGGPIDNPNPAAPNVTVPPEETAPTSGDWSTVSQWWKDNWKSFLWAPANLKAMDRQLFGVYSHSALHGPIRQPWPGIRMAMDQIEVRSLNGWSRSSNYNPALPWNEQPADAYAIQPCIRLASAAPTDSQPHSPEHAQSYWKIHTFQGGTALQQQGQQAGDWTLDESTLGTGQIYDTLIVERGSMRLRLGNVAVRNSVFMAIPFGPEEEQLGAGFFLPVMMNTRSTTPGKQAGPNSVPSFVYSNTFLYAIPSPNAIYPTAWPLDPPETMRPLYPFNNVTLLPSIMGTINEPADTLDNLSDTSALLGDIDAPHRPVAGSALVGALYLVPALDADGNLRPELAAQAARGAFEAVPTVEVSPAQGAVTFTATGEGLQSGNFADGPAWIVAPYGTVTVQEPTPAQTTIDGFAANGVMVNPLHGSGQAFDARPVFSSGYNDANLADTWPRTVSTGDVVVKAVSNTDPAIDPSVDSTMRRGLVTEYAACYILSEAPAAGALAPAATGWTGRSGLTPYTPDIAAFVAGITPRDTSGHVGRPTYEQIMARIDKFAPVYAIMGTSDPLGYRGLFPAGMGENDDLYGRNITRNINNALLALISSDFTTAQKEAICTRLVSHGIQWYDSYKATDGTRLDPNGGHFQFAFPVMALMLHVTGRTADLATLRSQFGGNYKAVFEIDAAVAATLAPHTSLLDPFWLRKRNLNAISGTTFTIETNRVGDSGDPTKGPFGGYTITNGTVSTTVTGDVPSAFDIGSNVSSYGITVADATGFSQDDTVWFIPPYWPREGQFDWSINGTPAWWNPMPTATYRGLNFWAGAVLALKGMGIWHSEWDPVAGYVDAAMREYPTASFDHPSHADDTWSAEFWAEYAAAIVGQTQVSATANIAPFVMAPPTVTVVSDNELSIALAGAPYDGGSTITSYDLRYSTDESTWTTVTGITSPRAITGLPASTLHYVQTRAVNAVGAGLWSRSRTATTEAVGGYVQQFVDNNGTACFTEASGIGGNETAFTFSAWVNFQSRSNYTRLMHVGTVRSTIAVGADGDFYVGIIDTANSIQYDAFSVSGNVIPIGTTVHVYVACDMANDFLDIRINGSPVSMVTDPATFDGGSGLVDFDQPMGFLCRHNATERSDLHVADYMVFNSIVPVADLYNGGTPPDPTTIGSPLVLMTGAASVWNAGTNAGSAGNLTVVSATFTDV